MTNPTARTTRRAALLLAACAWLGHATAQAQSADYPNKPIRMVVTFPPGGSTDAVIRLIAPRLGEQASASRSWSTTSRARAATSA